MVEPVLVSFLVDVLLVPHLHHKLIGEVISQPTQIFQLSEVVADTDGVDHGPFSQLTILLFAENIFHKVIL